MHEFTGSYIVLGMNADGVGTVPGRLLVVTVCVEESEVVVPVAATATGRHDVVDFPLVLQAERFRARARTARPEEKPALWQRMAGIWPAYAEYQVRTSRDIPVVILERV